MTLMLAGAKRRSSFSQSANDRTKPTGGLSQGPPRSSANRRHSASDLEYHSTVVGAHAASAASHNLAACVAGTLSSCSSRSATVWRRTFAATPEHPTLGRRETGGPSEGSTQVGCRRAIESKQRKFPIWRESGSRLARDHLLKQQLPRW